MSDIRLGAEKGRGPRGERGERGHRGRTGPTGPTFVNVDSTTLQGDGSIDHPLVVVGVKGPTSGPGVITAGTGLAPGMPFYIDSSGIGQPAQSDTLQHATAIGVVVRTIPQPIDDLVEYVLLAAFFILLPSGWDARTGQVGGLTPGATYYVGATPGSLTSTKPVAGYSTKIGVAQSPTVLVVQIGEPVKES